ncbi:MAG: SDR family NAD(P)-dependent oxidoreductase [Ignavibacteriaceae bacterium]|nr:SDR family NAD(P)-dependent oxidoreductase [Ignavibacteriaceae bacterium]
MGRLQNKIVFITGASSGIGKASAYAFAAEGADLILAARRIEKLNEIENELKKKFKVDVLTIQLDVRNKKDVKKAITSLSGKWRSIDILLNNAGLAKGMSKIYEGDTEHWDEMIDTNVKGLLYVSREIIPLMVERMQGHVINLGSIAGYEVYPNGNVYCASKFAVNGISKAMRLDLYDKNIRVTSIDPGMVETEFSEVRFSGDKEKAKKVYDGWTPLSGEDIADTILWCALRPAHINISEVIIMGTAQGSTTLLNRK